MVSALRLRRATCGQASKHMSLHGQHMVHPTGHGLQPGAAAILLQQGAESAAAVIGKGQRHALGGPRKLQAAMPAIMMLHMSASSCGGYSALIFKGGTAPGTWSLVHTPGAWHVQCALRAPRTAVSMSAPWMHMGYSKVV
jgi:hypothetical protein